MTKSLLSAELAAAGMHPAAAGMHQAAQPGPSPLALHRSTSLPTVPVDELGSPARSPASGGAGPLTPTAVGRTRSQSTSSVGSAGGRQGTGSPGGSPGRQKASPNNFRSRYYSALNVGGKAGPIAVPERRPGAPSRHGHNAERAYAASAPLDIPSATFGASRPSPALSSTHVPACATFVRDPTTWGLADGRGNSRPAARAGTGSIGSSSIAVATPAGGRGRSASWASSKGSSQQSSAADDSFDDDDMDMGDLAGPYPAMAARRNRASAPPASFVPPHQLLDNDQLGIDHRPTRRDQGGV